MSTTDEILKTAVLGAPRFGWQPDGGGNHRLLRGGNALYLAADEHWLCLTVPLGVPGAGGLSLWRRLLELCRCSYLVKYSLDGEGWPLLQVEIPRVGLQRADCARAIEAVTVYLDRHRPLLRKPERVVPAPASAAEGTESAEVEDLFDHPALLQFFRTVEHRGWLLGKRLGDNRWRGLYRAQERNFTLYLSFDRSWACFEMPLAYGEAVQRTQTEGSRETLYRHLLRVNAQAYWARFGIDDAGEVVLLLDVPIEAFDLVRFRRATEALATYASESFYEVQILADLDGDRALAARLGVHAPEGAASARA